MCPELDRELVEKLPLVRGPALWELKVESLFPYHLTAIPNISKCAPPNSGPDPKNALGGSSFEK